MIGSFKSASSKQINQLNDFSFKWQRSFHDHIIRTTDSLKNIREYIIKPLRNHRFFPSVILNETKPSEESRLKRDSSPAFGGLRMTDEKGSE